MPLTLCNLVITMTIVVEKAAETYKEVAQDLNLPEELVREESRKLLLDTYVDNGTTGGHSGSTKKGGRVQNFDVDFWPQNYNLTCLGMGYA